MTRRRETIAQELTQLALRIIAVAILPFAIFQTLGAVRRFFEWLGDVTDPHLVSMQPSSWEQFVDSSRQMTIALALLAVPVVLWFFAGIGTGSNAVPKQKTDNSN